MSKRPEARIGGWQPIETAPRNSVRLLLYGEHITRHSEDAPIRSSSESRGTYTYIGEWHPGLCRWVGGIFLPWNSPGHEIEINPTHWRPLPDDPHADFPDAGPGGCGDDTRLYNGAGA